MKNVSSKFYLAPLKLLTNFEDPFSNLLKRPSDDFDAENAYRKPPVILLNHTESHL
jgi:hypothetical protein